MVEEMTFWDQEADDDEAIPEAERFPMSAGS